MNKVTKMAMEWHFDGQDDARAIESTLDEVIYDILDNLELELSDKVEPKFERVMREIVADNIDWEAIDAEDKQRTRNAREWEEARLDAVRGH